MIIILSFILLIYLFKYCACCCVYPSAPTNVVALPSLSGHPSPSFFRLVQLTFASKFDLIALVTLAAASSVEFKLSLVGLSPFIAG